MDTPTSPPALEDHIALLDDLIELTYLAIVENIAQTAKLGDFLKMIELRRKLVPGQSGHKELLDLLNTIRKDLPTSTETSPDADTGAAN